MCRSTYSPALRTLPGDNDAPVSRPGRRHQESGVALPGVLLLAAFLVGVTGWLVGHVRSDVLLAMEQRDEAAATQLSGAAVQAVAMAFGHVPDWSAVAAMPALPCAAPSGPVAALDEAQERAWLQPATDAARPNDLLSQVQALFRRNKTAARQLSKGGNKHARLQRRMEAAGWTDPDAANYYALAEIALPATFAIAPFALFGAQGWLTALFAGGVGYVIPDLMLMRATRRHQKSIQNGLPDAIDLIVVCVEAGSSLDQAIVRASEELEFAVPALAAELRTVTNEIRAGKPRLEAFQGLAKRTQIDDVRSLVAMLTQTDRFGTSIAQALRTHAATARTKRRQRAEERAARVGVKMVFPLALCLVPALYVVCLGPVVVKIIRGLP